MSIKLLTIEETQKFDLLYEMVWEPTPLLRNNIKISGRYGKDISYIDLSAVPVSYDGSYLRKVNISTIEGNIRFKSYDVFQEFFQIIIGFYQVGNDIAGNMNIRMVCFGIHNLNLGLIVHISDVRNESPP